MAWRDDLAVVTGSDGRKLIGASFRGVPFFVSRSDRTGGRRIVTHELLGSDLPVIDDLGRKAAVFSVEGYVIGAEYITARNALLSALEDQSGPGELVHPYHGRVRVACASVTVGETTRDGGMATFRIEFRHAPTKAGVTVSVDTAGDVDSAADDAGTAADTSIANGYDVDNAPTYAKTSLRNEITLILNTLAMAAPSGTSLYVTGTMISLVATYADDPTLLFTDLRTAIEEGLTDDVRGMFHALMNGVNADSAALAVGDSDFRVTERANQQVLGDSTRLVLVAEAGRLMPDVDYATVEDADADVLAITTAIDDLRLTVDDVSLEAADVLRASIVRAIPGEELPNLKEISQRVHIPSLVLSHKLYGTVDGEADILARNRIRYPAFVSGDLSVVGDV